MTWVFLVFFCLLGLVTPFIIIFLFKMLSKITVLKSEYYPVLKNIDFFVSFPLFMIWENFLLPVIFYHFLVAFYDTVHYFILKLLISSWNLSNSYFSVSSIKEFGQLLRFLKSIFFFSVGVSAISFMDGIFWGENINFEVLLCFYRTLNDLLVFFFSSLIFFYKGFFLFPITIVFLRFHFQIWFPESLRF